MHVCVCVFVREGIREKDFFLILLFSAGRKINCMRMKTFFAGALSVEEREEEEEERCKKPGPLSLFLTAAR